MKDVHAQNLQPRQNNFLLNIDKKNFEDKKLSCFSELKESLSQKLMIFVDIRRLFNSNNNISNNNNNNSGGLALGWVINNNQTDGCKPETDKIILWQLIECERFREKMQSSKNQIGGKRHLGYK